LANHNTLQQNPSTADDTVSYYNVLLQPRTKTLVLWQATLKRHYISKFATTIKYNKHIYQSTI